MAEWDLLAGPAAAYIWAGGLTLNEGLPALRRPVADLLVTWSAMAALRGIWLPADLYGLWRAHEPGRRAR